MVTLYPYDKLGLANHGWLDARHHFSFARYWNPDRTGFGKLLVINDDKVEAGKGFGAHPHDNMEIITYVRQGAITHKDSMGNVKSLLTGQVQTMSAGTGLTHSEFNGSPDEEVHLYQMWIMPKTRGIEPRYHEWHPPKDIEDCKLYLIASPNGKDGSAEINRDASLYLSYLKSGSSVKLPLNPERYGWLQIAVGEEIGRAHV